MSEFEGFPSLGKGTVLPNLFFTAVLPRLRDPAALPAFLWASRFIQDRLRGQRFVSVGELWQSGAVQETFEAFGRGRAALEEGLEECRSLRALLAVDLRAEGGAQRIYFLNDPPSRRMIVQARSGEIRLRPGALAEPVAAAERRPNIFRLYEEHIGTITPIVGDRLMEAEDSYPYDWIEDAFREAAELNARNWRYIETILRNWAEEGRPDETAGRDSLEERKRRYLGGTFGRGG